MDHVARPKRKLRVTLLGAIVCSVVGLTPSLVAAQGLAPCPNSYPYTVSIYNRYDLSNMVQWKLQPTQYKQLPYGGMDTFFSTRSNVIQATIDPDLVWEAFNIRYRTTCGKLTASGPVILAPPLSPVVSWTVAARPKDSCSGTPTGTPGSGSCPPGGGSGGSLPPPNCEWRLVCLDQWDAASGSWKPLWCGSAQICG
jgi:hypothetical protein